LHAIRDFAKATFPTGVIWKGKTDADIESVLTGTPAKSGQSSSAGAEKISNLKAQTNSSLMAPSLSLPKPEEFKADPNAPTDMAASRQALFDEINKRGDAITNDLKKGHTRKKGEQPSGPPLEQKTKGSTPQ